MTIETKYGVDEMVWLMHNNAPYKTTIHIVITNSSVTGTHVCYSLHGVPGYLTKDALFTTREALLQSL